VWLAQAWWAESDVDVCMGMEELDTTLVEPDTGDLVESGGEIGAT